MALKSSTTTYELSITELKELFAKELGVKPYQVTVTGKFGTIGYGQGEHEVFTGLTVTVNHHERAPIDPRD